MRVGFRETAPGRRRPAPPAPARDTSEGGPCGGPGRAVLEDFAARGMGGRWMAMQDQELFFSRDARQPLEAGRGEMLGPRRAAPDLAAGFTLLELVLVLVIVGIGFSVV